MAGASAGVLLLGGDCGALGVARSLAPSAIPVRFLPGRNRMALFSRHVRSVERWPGAADPTAADWLESLAQRRGMAGWTLMPAGDEEVRLVTMAHERLARTFRMVTPPWEVTRHAADKQLTYARAAEIGIGHPRTCANVGEQTALSALNFPVILKPAVKEGANALTLSKAWRADDLDSLLRLLDEALPLAGPGGLIVQEMIPDDGLNQFSYCAFYVDGAPRVVMPARRVRQSPHKIGTGTYVETLPPQPYEAEAEAFLRSLSYTGLVEIEFMRDPRDGRFKLIDVNPRIWTWHALGLAAGVNFALAAWRHANGREVPPGRAAAGRTWLHFLRDAPAALGRMAAGELGPAAYLAQVLGASSRGAFAWTDPLPALADVPLALGRRLMG